jgi:hypothetical protein
MVEAALKTEVERKLECPFPCSRHLRNSPMTDALKIEAGRLLLIAPIGFRTESVRRKVFRFKKENSDPAKSK